MMDLTALASALPAITGSAGAVVVLIVAYILAEKREAKSRTAFEGAMNQQVATIQLMADSFKAELRSCETKHDNLLNRVFDLNRENGQLSTRVAMLEGKVSQ